MITNDFDKRPGLFFGADRTHSTTFAKKFTGGDQKNLQIQMKGTGGIKELQSSIGSLTNKPKCHWMSGVEESPFDRVTKLLTFTTG